MLCWLLDKQCPKGNVVGDFQLTARTPYIEAKQQYSMNAELNQTLSILEGLTQKAILLNNGEHNSDLQKAIVGIIRGSEFAFEDLTGVKYNSGHGTYRDPEDTIPN